MDNIVLNANNITKRYSNGRGVFEVSFALERGDTFGLLGANGAGKTTVMKMLTGLCAPNSGEINVFGYDIIEQREKALEKVGAIIESPTFYPYLSAKQNLDMALEYYPETKMEPDRADKILEQVSLSAYKNDKAAKYSLGMKQRLGIALSMAGNPELMILDEPSNGLDIEGRVDIRNIILDLSKSRESTFLISSHLSEEIEKTCTKVGIMKEGRLCCVESMDRILSGYPDLETFYLETIRSAGREAV